MYIFQVMDVTVQDIATGDWEALPSGPSYRCGDAYMAYIGEIEDNWGEDFSPQFLEIMRKARECGCEYVRITGEGQ